MKRKSSDKISIGKTFILVIIAAIIYYLIWLFLTQESVAGYDDTLLRQDHISANQCLTPATNPNVDQITKEYVGFTVNFNPTFHIPNWVSWELTADEVNAKRKRKDNFRTDPDIAGCPNKSDYKGSGYDRGHMAPSADMRWDSIAMDQSCLFTNICPQLKELNGGTWKYLEEQCRLWAEKDSAIIIICGPILTPKPSEFIGKTEVAVPHAFFKVVIAPYANPPRGIGFIMPNGKVDGVIESTAVAIDSIEAITGHDFCPTLPDSIQQIIESNYRFYTFTARFH